MFRVLEAFSGIGSQAKALKKAKIAYEIVATVDWNIHAIFAYDIIHNGKQDLEKYENLSKKELLNILKKYSLSTDGKKKAQDMSLRSLSEETLKRVLCSIERSNNLVSITDVKAENLPNQIDLFTYSFPCQDLSICGFWHGNHSGIDRNANNRSGMLWEVERILKEYIELDKELPKFLLMENVSNILSSRHIKDFNVWLQYLESIGYHNQVYTLDASKFGVPQSRVRTYMLSVKCGNKKEDIEKYFSENNLQTNFDIGCEPLKAFLRTDYRKTHLRIEAEESTPNYTPSRDRIYNDNILAFDGKNKYASVLNTLTTKQDRNPTSGVINYQSVSKPSVYRNLTPRECFLLMGFDENDFQILVDNNFYCKKNSKFLTMSNLIRMAGNSIVVNVLEEIFKQMEDINNILACDNSILKKVG